MDGREVLVNQKVLCRACANGKYYTEPKTEHPTSK
jgi:formylmethanofuran dehydrogenase subunit E